MFDHFGLIAPLYERLIPLRNPEKFIQIAGFPIQGALLDAGGGTGRVAKSLHGLAGQIVVADLSTGMLEQIPGVYDIWPVNSRSESLPFADQYFERVLMVDAFHHVINQPQTAAELWRVLQIGGRLVIEEPDIRKMIVKVAAIGEKIMLMRSHFLAPPAIAKLFDPRRAHVRVETEDFNAWVIVDKLKE